MHVLVIGGAGYIGSHCVRQLQAAGHKVVVLDSLVNGHRQAVPSNVPFYQLDMGESDRVERLLREESIEIVMNFAAFAYVGESAETPLKYYENNVSKTISLLNAMRRAKVDKMVFSSSCTVLGDLQSPLDERATPRPVSPYGRTKAMVEAILSDCVKAYGMSVSVFRYFNAAGAAADGTIGEDHDPETHLIPLAIQCALGRRDKLRVFGDDYDTPDGTCLRDYVHVDDIARAHIAVFPKLENPASFHLYHLGTGRPTSVLEVIRAVELISGHPVRFEFSPRRPGDAAVAFADKRKAVEELGWTPRFVAIDSTVESAWKWHRDHPTGYAEKPAKRV